MLADVAGDAGIDQDLAALLATYDLRDQATIIETRLHADGRQLRTEVATKLQQFGHYSLAHGLLASLPSDQAVTTNFDELFETAATIDTRQLAVLPYRPGGAGGRWLLKLHGSVDDPESIVLTRSDFLNMPRRYGALMGLVQGLMMMKHMMFVGYSLSDEDFHELIHELRLARRGVAAGTKMATVLTLSENPIAIELWSGELDIVPMISAGIGMPVDIPAAARQLELFLDLVGYLSTTTAAFFLDDAYAELTADETDLRRQLSTLVTTTADAKPGSVAYSVHAFLNTLGAHSPGPHP